jgi:transcriptional/translational regulatory protein YebC/TACO1
VLANEDGSVEVLCAPGDFHSVRDALARAQLKPELAEITMKPVSEIMLGGEDSARMQKLLDALESLDDVQEVYTTAVLETDA